MASLGLFLVHGNVYIALLCLLAVYFHDLMRGWRNVSDIQLLPLRIAAPELRHRFRVADRHLHGDIVLGRLFSDDASPWLQHRCALLSSC